MTEESLKRRTPAVVYTYLIPDISRIGRELGYAIALHGSMGRDLDLVAIPWTEEAVPAEELVEAIRTWLYQERAENWHLQLPEHKPHGRTAWSIPMHDGSYIDLSVMPRTG